MASSAARKTHVGGALEQVADQDVDGDLGPRFARQHDLLVGLGAQMGHETARQGLERFAGTAEVGSVVAKMREEGQVIPGPLQGCQPLPVFDDSGHPLQKLFFLLSHEAHRSQL